MRLIDRITYFSVAVDRRIEGSRATCSEKELVGGWAVNVGLNAVENWTACPELDRNRMSCTAID